MSLRLRAERLNSGAVAGIAASGFLSSGETLDMHSTTPYSVTIQFSFEPEGSAVTVTQPTTLRATLDAEYRFGRPHLYLTPQQIARVLIVRSRLGDTRAERAAERIFRVQPQNSLAR